MGLGNRDWGEKAEALQEDGGQDFEVAWNFDLIRLIFKFLFFLELFGKTIIPLLYFEF